jgi:hypothetical protein
VSDRERLAALLNAELDIVGSDWAVDYQATADALIRAGVSLTGSGLDVDADIERHQGEFHRYEAACVVCGLKGQVRITVEPQRIGQLDAQLAAVDRLHRPEASDD